FPLLRLRQVFGRWSFGTWEFLAGQFFRDGSQERSQLWYVEAPTRAARERKRGVGRAWTAGLDRSGPHPIALAQINDERAALPLVGSSTPFVECDALECLPEPLLDFGAAAQRRGMLDGVGAARLLDVQQHHGRQARPDHGLGRRRRRVRHSL